MLTHETLAKLREMHLPGMIAAYSAQQEDPELHGLSFDERFTLIVEREWTERRNHRLQRLLREAKLRIQAAPEDVDYRTPRGLDRAVMRSLFDGDWIGRRQNVVVSGPTGVGKTFIACALGHAACRLGHPTRYYRLSRLISDLAIAMGDGSYRRLMTQLAKVDLLILDDWGMSDLSSTQGRDLLDVIDERSGARSTIIASQLPFKNWHGVVKDPTIADAILDRLLHNAHPLTLQGDSMRRVNSSLTSALDAG